MPPQYHSITPTITFKDARKAIEFYKKALGAQEVMVMPGPDGKGVMHAEIKVGDSAIMMGEEHPQNPCKSAQTLGSSPVSFYVRVPDVDAAFARAVSAGAQVKSPVAEAFWGDRMGSVLDPFGHMWMLAKHTRDLTPEQIAQGAKEAFAGCEKKK